MHWFTALFAYHAKPERWRGDNNFEVRVAASPLAMEEQLRTFSAAGDTARVLAGLCWPWPQPGADGTLVPDVVIGDWGKPWSKLGDRSRAVGPRRRSRPAGHAVSQQVGVAGS
ncbi:DNA/RNA helicase domain-containing protein [Nocardia sp. NPDC048505]|uniref:DNA/RNA helicase domain-containing protein n=1 Tax=unclassified Nocardia TaxID=2637762 RepID=UPI00340D0CB7